MAQDFYLRVPIPGGGYSYVHVDHARVTVKLITQLYTKHSSRGGSAKYFPVSSDRSTGREVVDVTPLQETLKGVVDSYRLDFEEIGKTGQEALKMLLNGLGIEPIFEAVARGEIEVATRAWEGVLHSLLAGVYGLVVEIGRHEAHVSGISASIEQMTSTMEDGESAVQRMYDDVIAGALQLLEATARLEKIEGELETLARTVDQGIDRWAKRLSLEAEPFAGTQSFFESPKEGAGFNLEAFQFARDTKKPTVSMPNVELAQLHVTICHEAIESVMEEWRELRKIVERDVIPRRTRISQLCADLAKGSRAMREYRRNFGIAHRPPFDLPTLQGRITADQFSQAAQLADDARWGPETTRARVEGLATRIIARMNQPVTPQRLQQMIEQATRFIGQVQAVLQLQEEPAHPVRAITETDGGAQTPEIPQTTLNPHRAQEIYEMIRCVGLTLTANPYFLAASTIRSMLDILRFIDRVSTQEAHDYREMIKELSHASGERIRSQDSKHVAGLRTSSQATWVQFITKGKPRLKMTQAGVKRTEPLLSRHGLTVEAIREGSKGRKAEQEALYASKKANKADEPEDDSD